MIQTFRELWFHFLAVLAEVSFVILLLSQSGISVAIASDLRLAVWRVNPPSAKILTMFSFQCLITTYLFVSLRGPVFVPEL